LAGRLSDLRLLRARRLRIVRGVLSDASGSLPVVWFNRPYLATQIDRQAEYLLHGPLRQGKSGPELSNPSCEPAGVALHGRAARPDLAGVPGSRSSDPRAAARGPAGTGGPPRPPRAPAGRPPRPPRSPSTRRGPGRPPCPR